MKARFLPFIFLISACFPITGMAQSASYNYALGCEFLDL